MHDVLTSLIRGIGQGQVTIVDLTQTLKANTPRNCPNSGDKQ